MHFRSSSLRRLLMAVLVMASVVVTGGGSAIAAPSDGQPWPVCGPPPASTYCIETFKVDGASALANPDWRLRAWSVGDRVVQWQVHRKASDGTWGPPPVEPRVELKLNLGLIQPVLAEARAMNMTYLPGGSAATGYTITVAANAVPTKWRMATDEGNCAVGYCGSDTTRADTESTALYGSTDTVPFWSLEEQQRFGGFAAATDAQSHYPYPLFSRYPFPHVLLQVGNVHLGSDGTPASGSVSAHLTARMLSDLGTTAEQAVSSGLHVLRVEEAIGTSVASSVTRSLDGGVDLQVPRVPYSSIQLWISGSDPGHPDGEPLIGQTWPVCHGERQKFCVQSLEVNGIDRRDDATVPWVPGDWRVNAYLLDRNSVNWYVERWNGEHWRPATNNDGIVKLSVNTGTVRPLYTSAIADLSSFTSGGDSVSGYSLAATGSPVEIQWIVNDGGACFRGECGGPDTRADTAGFLMGGNSQNLETWDPASVPIFADMWVATNAQYHSTPRFFRAAPEEGRPAGWQLRLGNPHLAKDELRPVRGTYDAYIPPGLLKAMGTTAEEATETGLVVHRTEGTSVTTLPMVVTRVGDGVRVEVSSIGFSTPTLTFTPKTTSSTGAGEGTAGGEGTTGEGTAGGEGTTGEGTTGEGTTGGGTTSEGTTGGGGGEAGNDPAGVEGTPGELQAVHIDPLDGAVAIRFQRPLDPGASRVTGYNLRCMNGDSVVTATAPRPVAVDLRPLANGQTWRCSVQAKNAQGHGPWSWPIEVTPHEDAVPVPPGAPVTMTTRRRVDGSARIVWSLPLSTGGAKITGYRVKVCARAVSHCIISTTTRDRTIVVARRLLNARRYVVTVRAINRAGSGDKISRKVALR